MVPQFLRQRFFIRICKDRFNVSLIQLFTILYHNLPLLIVQLKSMIANNKLLIKQLEDSKKGALPESKALFLLVFFLLLAN